MPALKRVGHKGAERLAAGNTPASFDAALACGVDMIEFDVLPERPGSPRLLLAHDFRDARRAGAVSLEEGLDHLAAPAFAGVELDVDLKLAGYEEAVLAALDERGLLGRSLISTMEAPSLRAVRRLAPAVRLGWSIPRTRRDLLASPLTRYPAFALAGVGRQVMPLRAARAVAAGEVDAIMCHWALASPRMARLVSEAGGELYVWTVDDPARLRALAQIPGVTGVITNDPRLFQAITQVSAE